MSPQTPVGLTPSHLGIMDLVWREAVYRRMLLLAECHLKTLCGHYTGQPGSLKRVCDTAWSPGLCIRVLGKLVKNRAVSATLRGLLNQGLSLRVCTLGQFLRNTIFSGTFQPRMFSGVIMCDSEKF